MSEQQPGAGPGETEPGADSGNTLEIIRSFRARPREVFAAWTGPEELGGWWGPEGFVVPPGQASFQLKPGGTYRACMVDPASGTQLWWSGSFEAVQPPRHLAFSLQWETDGGPAGPTSRIELAFREHDDGTRQEFRQGAFPSRTARDESAAQWQDAFDRLSLYLARTPR